jgi:hypothetical protein
MHSCIVLKSILITELLSINKRCATESLIFLNNNKYGRIKSKTCTSRSTLCNNTNHKEVASPISPTAMTDSHLITIVVDTKQGSDKTTAKDFGSQEKYSNLILGGQLFY